MSTLKEKLEAQCNLPKYAEDAKDCLLIHEYLIKTDKGHIWQSRWDPLVSICFIGSGTKEQKVYYPTDLGKLVVAQLRSMQNEKLTEEKK